MIKAEILNQISQKSLSFILFKVDVSECLAANNLNRSKHGAPNLQWDASLASGSANWALYLAQKSEVQLEHSVANGQYGENIYYSATSVVGTVASCKKAVESWWVSSFFYLFSFFLINEALTFLCYLLSRFTLLCAYFTSCVKAILLTFKDSSAFE